jgi:S-adenosylhomocysteine hydrolase
MLSVREINKIAKAAGLKVTRMPITVSTQHSKNASWNNPQSVSDLPALQALVNATKQLASFKGFENTIFVCVQHGLSSTVDLLKCLIALGAKPKNIFWLGKSYSNSPEVVEKIQDLGIQVKLNSKQTIYGGFDEAFANDISLLWNTVETYYEKHQPKINEIIILDDGGKCLRATPHNLLFNKNLSVIGVEQTSSGINGVTKYYPLPIVNVAGSALKEVLETPLIAEAVKEKSLIELEPFLENAKRISVIGLGKVGKAVAKMYANAGFKVFVYDPSLKDELSSIHENIRKVNNIGQACAISDIIIGCSGMDISAGEALHSFVTGNDKVLLSCSSRDTEFKTLLQDAVQTSQPLKEDVNAYKTITYKASSNGPEIKILAGGFPINFDGSPDSVPRKHIQGTRAAILGAAVYARYLADLKKEHPEALNHEPGMPNLIKLPASIQQFIAKNWQVDLPTDLYTSNDQEVFDNLDIIKNKSIGRNIDFTFPSELQKAKVHDLSLLAD